MLEWTGERFLPWIKESTIAYEHLHRYAYAATFVRDRRVLDLACGEGYGSKMLAAAAASVLGIDIDEKAVAHAAAKYGGATLQYVCGSITAVPVSDNNSYDAIVCFEAIEHIADHEELLGEVKRLLKPDGIFLVSTPNKAVYHDQADEENPFHLKELYFEEFEQLLARHFKDVRYLGQRTHPGSSIWPIGPGTGNEFKEFVLERGDADYQFISNDRRVPLYFIAIASDSPGRLSQPGSVLVDHSNGLILEKDAQLLASVKEVQWRERQLEEGNQTIASLQQAVKWRERQIEELTQGLEWTQKNVAEAEKAIASQREALEWSVHQAEELVKEKTALATRFQDSQQQLAVAAERLRLIDASYAWRLILRARNFRDRLAPAGSSRRKLFDRVTGRGRSRG